uniref:ATP-binding protein n=1 Tax=Candidatus Kentrum sp. FM TaxID=2126340 RepID=A0A450T7C0_9GAMM|nr:MAG: hypothetical protein BECKFM1743A_GA0114220_103112 [Candidatus Kentron sp. FM]
MTERTDLLVRYRNDGDDFHVLWTARRALRLFDPKSGLAAVAVEGISEREGIPAREGILAIDTAEYYGSEDLAQATQVVYSQLKYSTTAPDKPWTVSGLKDTLQGFADRFTELCQEIGATAVADKVRVRFISNRPIAEDVGKAFDAAISGTPVEEQNKRTRTAYTSLLKATGLTHFQFSEFAAQVDLLGDHESHDAQARLLETETGGYGPFLDTDASIRMKELVRSKGLSKSARDKTIDLNTLLRQFGLGSERELFPAEPKFDPVTDPVPRAQEEAIVRAILDSPWPVIIRAPGGVGKSVLAQRLPARLPAGSEAVVFDGFAGGDYRRGICKSRIVLHNKAKMCEKAEFIWNK